jgi:hypothetical protein
MSLPLATKGVLNSGVTQATKGMIYHLGPLGEILQAIIPNLIARRDSIVKVVKRVVISKVARREDV